MRVHDKGGPQAVRTHPSVNQLRTKSTQVRYSLVDIIEVKNNFAKILPTKLHTVHQRAHPLGNEELTQQ